MVSALDIERQLERRRSAVAREWDLGDGVVMVRAGDPIPLPGRGDLTYPFRAHSEYLYLTDRNRPGGVLTFDPNDGWEEFVPPVQATERLWLGTEEDPPGLRSTGELDDWLAARSGRPLAVLGVEASACTADAVLSAEVRYALERIRRPKDPVEIERMMVAERATRAAFQAVVPFLRDGITERRAQIELEAEALRSGADGMAYDTIVGSGPNSAVLHFAPSQRRMRDGELVLIDAGGEYLGYASDITRTYAVGGEFSTEQRELFDVVKGAQDAAIARCLPGTEWRDVHLEATRAIAEGLVACGILRGAPDGLIEEGSVELLFPHGIGHLVGLGVRDAGGVLPGRTPVFPQLRIDLPLEPGMITTVEPGVYFSRVLLEDRDTRRKHSATVDWDRIDTLLDFGGIRLEHNVLITEAGPEVITADVPLV